jgi:hypothetical protein
LALRVEDLETVPQQLAGLVKVSRLRFSRIYDELWKQLKISDTAGVYRGEPFLSAVLGDDGKPAANDFIAFRRAFTVAQKGDWLKLLVSRCIERAAIDHAAIDLKAVAAKETEKTIVQAAIDRIKLWDDPNALLNGLLRTMPKICLVRINEPGGVSGQGTGFLIGTQTVLTAWHVIEPLLDDKGQQRLGSEKWLRVEFDFIDPLAGGSAREKVVTYDVVPRWLEDNSPCHPSEKPTTGGIPQTLAAAAIGAEQLDFAVIRLKGSPGRDRGVVKLRTDPVELKKNEPMKLLVFQHPNRFPQRVADGPLTELVGAGNPRPRFRHEANTAIGSSGGLCVDARFECVGLHQAAIVDAADKPIANQAVQAALIVPRLLGAHGVDPTLDPLIALADTKEPVIGRGPFQESVWSCARGIGSRAVIVRGARRTGLSFSEKILRSLLPPKETLVIKLTADQIGRDAVALATKVLEACGAILSSGDSLPSKSEAATATAAWLRDQLLPDFARRLAAVALGRQIWLVLDDLDLYTPPEDDAYNLLLALIMGEQDAPFMRFLLIGMDKVPVPQGLCVSDFADWPVAGDVDLYIRRYLTPKNVAITDEVRTNFVSSVMREAKKSPSDRWGKALQFIVDHIHPMGGGA